MLVINSGSIRLDMDPFHILFLLNKDDRYRYIAEIDRLNSEIAFTLNIYEYRVETINGNVNKEIPLDSLRDAIDKHNVVIRLMDDADGNHYYAFETIDPSQNLIEWRKCIHSFIIEVAQCNYGIIQKNIDKIVEEKKEGYETRVTDFKELLDILDNHIERAKTQFHNYIISHAPQIKICSIETTYYRKINKRYGILIDVEDRKIPVFFKNIDQKMLYIAALLRYKAGRPLYLHELFNNSRGIQSKREGQRDKLRQWIKKLYKIIVDMDNRTVDKWLKKISESVSVTDKSLGVVRKTNPLYQAKSDANRCIKTALKLHSSATEYCLLQTKFDENNDSYYTFSCPVKNILVDENLIKLVDEYSENTI